MTAWKENYQGAYQTNTHWQVSFLGHYASYCIQLTETINTKDYRPKANNLVKINKFLQD